jgi:hypothetical protein
MVRSGARAAWTIALIYFARNRVNNWQHQNENNTELQQMIDPYLEIKETYSDLKKILLRDRNL